MTDTPPDAPAENAAQMPPAEESGALDLVIDAAGPADDDAGPYVETTVQDFHRAPPASDSLISELTHRHLEEVVIPQRDNADEESPSSAH